jgi:prepilin-type processing-associated H-X9-DG protein
VGEAYWNLSPNPATATTLAGKCDYAANLGDKWTSTGSATPSSISAGDGMSATQWATMQCGEAGSSGIVCTHSQTRMSDIKDGTSNTYLAGEKYVNPDMYTTGQDGGDDQTWDMGCDIDIVRCTDPAYALPPMQDYSELPGTPPSGSFSFGSAHAAGFNMVFCDGSVHMINYSISPTIHSNLANRKDMQAIGSSQF